MSRSPRFLPKNQDGVLVEVSSRTVNAWALMRPSAELSDVTVGGFLHPRESVGVMDPSGRQI